MTLEERLEVILRKYEEITNQNTYLQSHPSNCKDFKVEIPEFEGEQDPDDFLEWLQTVERIFKFNEIPENKKIKLVAHKLRKYALSWWTNLLAKRVKQRKEKIRTWEKMRAKLKARFLPPNYVQINYSSKRKLATPPPEGKPFNKGSPTIPPKLVEPSTFPKKNPAPQKSQAPPIRPNASKRCFKCQGLGHIASECPNRRIISLAEWEANKEEEEKEDHVLCLREEDQEEVVKVADEGELLVLRRVMSGHKEEKEEQSENIFHSRCTVQEKVCSLIIDGGSCANVASSNMGGKVRSPCHGSSPPLQTTMAQSR